MMGLMRLGDGDELYTATSDDNVTKLWITYVAYYDNDLLRNGCQISIRVRRQKDAVVRETE